MLQKLIPPLERAIHALFEPLSADYPMCTSVLSGVYPGNVFADEPTNPRTGLLTTFFDEQGVWAFLVGRPDNADFNRALHRAIWERKIIDEKTGVIFFNCYPPNWQAQLPVITAPREPIPMLRKHYVARKMDFEWRARLAEGFSVEPLEPSMLSRPDFYIPEEARGTLGKWQGIVSPDFQDFGFDIVYQDSVVSWATVDFVACGRGDLGYYTEGNYRRRGLGTIVTAAAIEHGLSKGLTEIHWTCAADNTGSIRTAERLGLEYAHDYESYLLIFDEGQYLSQLSYYHLSSRHYQQAADTLDSYFAAVSDPAVIAYHDAARTWAALGNRNKALSFLANAVKEGWSNPESTAASREFAPLHDSPVWTRLLEQMHRNRAKHP
jgi:RimJ/RimL family protein N-acetyltransferase